MSNDREVVRIEGEVPKRDRISFSEWMLFRTGCQVRWKLDYLDGLRSSDESMAMSFGTAVHATVEDLLNPDEEKRCSLDQALELLNARIDVALEKLLEGSWLTFGPFPEGESAKYQKSKLTHPDELKAQGARILRDILKIPEIAKSQVVRFELKLEEPLERTDGPIMFKGFIDFLAKIKNGRGQSTLLIKDFKTCTWGWPFKKKEDFNVLAQPRLYKHFLCKKINVDPKMVRTGFSLLKKTPKDGDIAVDDFKVSSSERDLSMTIEALQEDITRMRSGVYEKNRSNCVKPWGMCPYYNTEHCTGEIEKPPVKIGKKK